VDERAFRIVPGMISASRGARFCRGLGRIDMPYCRARRWPTAGACA
jgi:hypothetical protein